VDNCTYLAPPTPPYDNMSIGENPNQINGIGWHGDWHDRP